MAALPLPDIQGFVLRTYAMPLMRVFVLRVGDPSSAARFLASLVDGDDKTLRIATAAAWDTKPESCLNIGFTYAGLHAIRLPDASLGTFPEEFAGGIAARADRIGDTGHSAPSFWKGGLGGNDVHALAFLFAQTDAALEEVTARLRERFASGPAFVELSAHDGRELPGRVAHFGYRDGFGQPTIEGGLPPRLEDVLPKAPAGEFLLGHASQFDDFMYPVPEPASQLGHNGSFLAFRILEQDCRAFEHFLVDAATQTGLDPELIAAKLCGRWRNGIPVALSPASPALDLPPELYNSFDYAPTSELPDAFDDRRGVRCPIGAHIRRMNPRHGVVAGNSGLKRRIVRRGLPYGPPYDPSRPDDGIERGLLGVFIGVSLKDQFEFLMSEWANKGAFAPGLRDTRDPIVGANAQQGATFLLPVEGQKPLEVTGLSRFVTCRGGAYCFVPSVTAVRYLSELT
jgi:deferrochelatase/peroxidase EfeB